MSGNLLEVGIGGQGSDNHSSEHYDGERNPTKKI
jgi:hypothetical protein